MADGIDCSRPQRADRKDSMKVAIFSPYATVVPHFETELDIAQQHLDQGDEVEFVNCIGELANCDFNENRDPARCQQCIGRREMGLELLRPQVPAFNFQAAATSAKLDIQTDFDSIQELKAYQKDGFDIGYAALSSLVSICRDPDPDIVEHRELIGRFLKSGWQTYERSRSYLAQSRPDRVYVFNGRFAAMRAVFRACQAERVECFLHERGCDLQHYELAKNHMLHDIGAIENVIRNFWERASQNPDRGQIAAQWYLDRFNRVERNWHSFVKDQQTGQLPIDWNAGKKNIGIFCSSDDEFVAIGDSWQHRLYANQVEGVAAIAQSIAKTEPSIHFTLRVHPNLKDVHNRRKSEMLGLSFPNLTVVPPESPIDTYELLRACDSVVTFGSSVGMEAVYWDRPSILIGPCYYQNLGGLYRPIDHQQTLDMICGDLKPLPKQGALMYGFWFQTRGHQHRYYRASGLFEGSFKGEVLYARPEKKSLGEKIKKKTQKLVKSLTAKR